MIAIVVLLSLVAPVDGTGAYCSAWHVDLADAPDVYDGRVFLQKHVETYGVNRYVAIFSHPSQWWYEVYAVFFEEELGNISDVYVRSRSGKRHLCLHRVRVHGLVDAHAAASLRELSHALA